MQGFLLRRIFILESDREIKTLIYKRVGAQTVAKTGRPDLLEHRGIPYLLETSFVLPSKEMLWAWAICSIAFK
jgi:hypothetical protein